MEEELNFKDIRLPKDDELFAVVISELGAARMVCYCQDGKERICRIPGRLKSKFWIKEGDLVLVKPWQVQGDQKGDIIWQYKKLEVNHLKEKGLLRDLPI